MCTHRPDAYTLGVIAFVDDRRELASLPYHRLGIGQSSRYPRRVQQDQRVTIEGGLDLAAGGGRGDRSRQLVDGGIASEETGVGPCDLDVRLVTDGVLGSALVGRFAAVEDHPFVVDVVDVFDAANHVPRHRVGRLNDLRGAPVGTVVYLRGSASSGI